MLDFFIYGGEVVLNCYYFELEDWVLFMFKLYIWVWEYCLVKVFRIFCLVVVNVLWKFCIFELYIEKLMVEFERVKVLIYI